MTEMPGGNAFVQAVPLAQMPCIGMVFDIAGSSSMVMVTGGGTKR